MGKIFGAKLISPELYKQIAENFLTVDSNERKKRVDLQMLANFYFRKYPMPESIEAVETTKVEAVKT